MKSSGKSYDFVLPLSRLFISKPELLKGNTELTNTGPAKEWKEMRSEEGWEDFDASWTKAGVLVSRILISGANLLQYDMSQDS